MERGEIFALREGRRYCCYGVLVQKDFLESGHFADLARKLLEIVIVDIYLLQLPHPAEGAKVSDSIFAQLQLDHVVEMLSDLVAGGHSVTYQLHGLDAVLLFGATDGAEFPQPFIGEGFVIEVGSFFIPGEQVLEFLLSQVLLHGLVANFDALLAQLLIQLKHKEFFHEFLLLLLTGSIIYLVDMFVVDAYYFLDRLPIGVLAEGLDCDLLALDIDANPILRKGAGAILQFLALADGLLVVQTRS